MNNPTVVLEALDARNQGRFKFSKGGEDTLDGTRAWTLRFTEQARPTFITTFKGEDEPLTGRAWVDPMVGRLLRVEITVAARSANLPFTATINVTFQEDPRLRLWVPATMTEQYSVGARILAAGDAHYTDYRRFGVETKEELANETRGSTPSDVRGSLKLNFRFLASGIRRLWLPPVPGGLKLAWTPWQIMGLAIFVRRLSRRDWAVRSGQRRRMARNEEHSRNSKSKR